MSCLYKCWSYCFSKPVALSPIQVEPVVEPSIARIEEASTSPRVHRIVQEELNLNVDIVRPLVLDNEERERRLASFQKMEILVIDSNRHRLKQMQAILVRLGIQEKNIKCVSVAKDIVFLFQSMDFNVIFIDLAFLPNRLFSQHLEGKYVIGISPLHSSHLSSTPTELSAICHTPLSQSRIQLLLAQRLLSD
jgi:hypothetical protein